MTDFVPTERTTVRVAKRASYDRELAHAILDAAFVAHVGAALAAARDADVAAIARGRGAPIVALESTIITHGSNHIPVPG